jgi:hypothetical protein
VDDARRVRRRHPFAGLNQKIAGLAHAERPPFGDVLGERAPLEQLHHDVRLSRLEHARIERFDDMRVADVAGRRRLAQEARDDGRDGRHLLAQELERAPVPGERVLHLVH